MEINRWRRHWGNNREISLEIKKKHNDFIKTNCCEFTEFREINIRDGRNYINELIHN